MGSCLLFHIVIGNFLLIQLPKIKWSFFCFFFLSSLVVSKFWSITLCLMLNYKLFEWSSWKPVPLLSSAQFWKGFISLSVLHSTNLREEQVTGRNTCLSSGFGHVSIGESNRLVCLFILVHSTLRSLFLSVVNFLKRSSSGSSDSCGHHSVGLMADIRLWWFIVITGRVMHCSFIF